MIPKAFFLYSLFQFIVLTVLKVYFFGGEVFSSSGLQHIVYWLICAVLAVALVRRMGIINFLEAFFVVIFWVIGGVLVDLFITSVYASLSIFSNSAYWVGYLILGLSVIVFHKKRHVHIRKLVHHSHH